MPKAKYYNIDTGMFVVMTKVCFCKNGFEQILKDHSVPADIKAFDIGIAETHLFTEDNAALIAIVFNLEELNDGYDINSVIAHEAFHATCRIIEHIGEDLKSVGEEVIAYTIEYLVKQINIAMKEHNVGKTSRSKAKQTGKGSGRSVVQMDKLSDGSSGSDSLSGITSILRGVKDSDWCSVGKTEADILATEPSWLSGVRTEGLQ